MHCALRPILITNHESPYPKFVRIKSISLSKASANAPKFTSHHTLFYTPQRGGGWFRQTTKIYIHVLHLQSQGLEFLTKKKKDKLTHQSQIKSAGFLALDPGFVDHAPFTPCSRLPVQNDTLFQPRDPENRTQFSGASPFRPGKGVHPPWITDGS